MLETEKAISARTPVQRVVHGEFRRENAGVHISGDGDYYLGFLNDYGGWPTLKSGLFFGLVGGWPESFG